ncbi:MAG: signal peptide peptidase SppA [Euryarchaeota archaeon]|nr:signal peptide peptidase SppA [Euryarchaeota archaeon]
MRNILIIAAAVLVVLLGISLLGAYVVTKQADGFELGDKVAVIKIYGTISMGDSTGVFGEEVATPASIISKIDKAERDGSVKAIVFEINSPGGSVVASEEIANRIKETQKPTVAWMSEIATSGAYYVASPCDYIVADRGTITGSIGVISVFPEYSGLLQKIGVNMTVIKAGEYKDFSTGYRPMTEEEQRMMEEVILEIYDMFTEEVAANRNLSVEYVKEVAEGRVYSGPKAKELGLVDEVGTRRDAVRIAGELGGIEGEPKTVTYTEKSFLEEFMGMAFYHFGAGFARGLGINEAPMY